MHEVALVRVDRAGVAGNHRGKVTVDLVGLESFSTTSLQLGTSSQHEPPARRCALTGRGLMLLSGCDYASPGKQGDIDSPQARRLLTRNSSTVPRAHRECGARESDARALLFVLVLGVAMFAGLLDACEGGQSTGGILCLDSIQNFHAGAVENLHCVCPDFVGAATVGHHHMS